MEIISMVVSLGISIAVWVACTIIHKNKGYSAFGGFCWGFFLGLIGLLVVLLEKPKQDKNQ